MEFPPLISLDLNQSQNVPLLTRGTEVYLPNSGPPNNCVIEENIYKIVGLDLKKPTENDNSIWASPNSDVDEEITCNND